MVKKVVRRAETQGHRHGFRVSGVLLIEAADNPSQSNSGRPL